MTIDPSLWVEGFDLYNDLISYKVEVSAIGSLSSGVGHSATTITLNRRPTEGTCSLNSQGSNDYLLQCTGFEDPDGIATYKFYGEKTLKSDLEDSIYCSLKFEAKWEIFNILQTCWYFQCYFHRFSPQQHTKQFILLNNSPIIIINHSTFHLPADFGDSLERQLGFNGVGFLNTRLPTGLEFNNYYMNILLP